MRPEVPILMITLQIPVLPDLDAEQVMEAIGAQVSEAIDSAKQKQYGANESDGGDESRAAAFSAEALEPFTGETQADLLEQLGYKSQA